MRGFSQPITENVTLCRGEEKITFVVHPQPVGYYPWLRGVFPPPVIYEGRAGGGTTTSPDTTRTEEYEDLFAFVLIAKCLEAGTMVSQEPEGRATRAQWHEYAVALRDEFRAAGFTSGEVRKLLHTATAVTQSVTVDKAEERRGNS